jgi:hypothetical protein
MGKLYCDGLSINRSPGGMGFLSLMGNISPNRDPLHWGIQWGKYYPSVSRNFRFFRVLVQALHCVRLSKPINLLLNPHVPPLQIHLISPNLPFRI